MNVTTDRQEVEACLKLHLYRPEVALVPTEQGSGNFYDVLQLRLDAGNIQGKGKSCAPKYWQSARSCWWSTARVW
jgi:hypothetical protein